MQRHDSSQRVTESRLAPELAASRQPLALARHAPGLIYSSPEIWYCTKTLWKLLNPLIYIGL